MASMSASVKAVLQPDLLEILVCPESKQPLVYFAEESFLYCPASKLKFRIDDGIPVMLISEAVRVPADEAERLLGQARQRGLANAGTAASA
jgi:uncharacterized protein YbaR (Trm112 family)